MKNLLIIVFLLNTFTSFCQVTLTLRPDGAAGKDELIDSRVQVASTNYDNSKDLASWSWTNSGEPSTVRSLIQFDLSKLPVDAIISDARLSFFCNTTSAIPQLHAGLNESNSDFTITY